MDLMDGDGWSQQTECTCRCKADITWYRAVFQKRREEKENRTREYQNGLKASSGGTVGFYLETDRWIAAQRANGIAQSGGETRVKRYIYI